MEGLYLLKEILEEGDYLCKLDLQDDFLCLYTWKICEVSMERHTVQVSGTCDNGQWHHNTVTQWQWQYTEVESATYKEPEVLRNGNSCVEMTVTFPNKKMESIFKCGQTFCKWRKWL